MVTNIQEVKEVGQRVFVDGAKFEEVVLLESNICDERDGLVVRQSSHPANTQVSQCYQ